MEELQLFAPLIPGLIAHGLVDKTWDDIMVLIRQAVPLLKVADKSKLMTSTLVLLSEGDHATVTLDALYDLGKSLIVLAKDPTYSPRVLAFVSALMKLAPKTN